MSSVCNARSEGRKRCAEHAVARKLGRTWEWEMRAMMAVTRSAACGMESLSETPRYASRADGAGGTSARCWRGKQRCDAQKTRAEGAACRDRRSDWPTER